MTISNSERQRWHDAADRATALRVKQLTKAYGQEVDTKLRVAFRWIAANAATEHIGALIAAFDRIAAGQFHEGYLDGLDSAALTEDERAAHEEALGFDTNGDEEGEEQS